MMIGGWRAGTAAVALATALMVSACGSSEDASSSSTTAATESTSSTVASTTAPESTTAAPSTTTLAEAVTTSGPATTVGPAPAADAVLAVISDRDGASNTLTLHTAADGSVVQRDEVAFEGFMYNPSFAAEVLIVNTNYEDFWFSCTGYNGVVREVLSDGSSQETLEGGLAELSDDATHMAYATASTCGPDEVDPANWVHAPLDTVVWRDLATGQEQAWQFPGAVLDSEATSPLTSMTLAGDQIVALVSGQLQVLDTTGSDAAAPAPVDIEVAEGEFISLLGVRPDGRVVAIRQASAQAGARIVEFDPATGAETEVINYPNDVRAVALDRTGTDLAVLSDGVLTINGTPVELEGVDPAAITSIGW